MIFNSSGNINNSSIIESDQIEIERIPNYTNLSKVITKVVIECGTKCFIQKNDLSKILRKSKNNAKKIIKVHQFPVDLKNSIHKRNSRTADARIKNQIWSSDNKTKVLLYMPKFDNRFQQYRISKQIETFYS